MDPISNVNDTPGSRLNAVPKRARIARMAAGVALTLILALVAGACNKAESEAPPEKGKGRAAKGGQDKGKGAPGKGGAAKNRPSKEEQEAQRKQIANVLVADKTGLRNQLAPNATTDYKGARLSTNQWGMRDKDYQLTPPPGTKRIAILGPAHVFGGGVKDGETFEQLVEDRLNREVSPRSGLKFEVLNFGVVNYTLMQQAIILSNGRVGVFQPDAVMIVGHQADLRSICDYVWRELQAGRSFPAPVEQVVRKAGVTTDMEQPAALKKLLPYAEDIAALALKDAGAEIRRMGAEPVFAIIPTPARKTVQKESQLLIDLAKAAGFAILNLADAFTKADLAKTDLAKLVLGKTDLQPNAEGHKVLAGRLYDGLTRMPAVLAADSEASAKRKTAARAAWNRELPARKKAAEDSAAKLAKADKPSVPPVPIEGWTVDAPDGGAATLESSRKDNWLRISISRLPKSSSSTIKVRKAPVAITSGQRYVLTLWLKAEANRPVGCRVADGAAPGGPLGESTELKAVTWWQEFSCSFTATGTKKDAQILLDLGANQTAVELSNIQLKNLTTGQVVFSTDPAWRGPARSPK